MVKPHPRLLARNWQEVASVDCEAARGGAKSKWDSESFDDADGRHVEKLVKVCTDEEGVIRNLVHKPKSSYISLELAVAVRKQVHRMHLPDGQIGNLRPGVVSAERDFPIRGRVWALTLSLSAPPPRPRHGLADTPGTPQIAHSLALSLQVLRMPRSTTQRWHHRLGRQGPISKCPSRLLSRWLWAPRHCRAE